SDLLVLKKNGKTIQSFYPVSEIFFATDGRAYHAYVTSIERDTVFLVQYDIRQFPTNLVVFILDTISVYWYGIDDREIRSFLKEKSNFVSGSGGALLGGGALLTTAGLATWIFAKPKTRYYAPPSLVITAAALGVLGYFMSKADGSETRLGKKYTLHYIHLK